MHQPRTRRLWPAQDPGKTPRLWTDTSYYLPALAFKRVAQDTGWSEIGIASSFSIALLLSGLLAPIVGIQIQKRGGRTVIVSGALLMAVGQLITAMAATLPIYWLGWAVLGAGMSCSLYDAAFSTIGQIYDTNARKKISDITLAGGFASTLFWPVSAYLIEIAGWRGTSLIYAGLSVAVLVPLYLSCVPGPSVVEPVTQVNREVGLAAVPVPQSRRMAFSLLAISLVIGSAVSSVIAVHLITILMQRGLSLVDAVALGTLLGPAQVCARILERLTARYFEPAWTLVTSSGLVTLGLILLHFDLLALSLATILYGAGAGLKSVAKGSVPLSLFGAVGYPKLLGLLALPALIAQAVSPTIASFAVGSVGMEAMFVGLIAASTVSLLASLALAVPQN